MSQDRILRSGPPVAFGISPFGQLAQLMFVLKYTAVDPSRFNRIPVRALMRQAAEELGQWVERHEEHNTAPNLVELLNAARERARKAELEREAREQAKAASNG
jgi:hypothetical protein